MKNLPDMLVLENSERDFETFRNHLDRDGVPHRPLWVRNPESFLNRLHDSAPRVIVADVGAPGGDVRSTLARVREQQPEVPVILLAARDKEPLALDGLDHGAADYVLKPELHRLSRSVRRAFDESFQSEQQQCLARELAFHQDIYRSLVGSIPYQIFRKNADGCFTFVNEPFARLVGKPIEQIIGRTDADFFPGDLARKYRRDDLRVIESGKMLETTETNQLPGREERIVKVVKVPIFDSTGRAIGVQGMFWNITEQKKAEDQIARQILTLNRVSDAIIECASDGTITYWNKAAENLYQRSAAEALGRNLVETLGIEKSDFLRIRTHLTTAGDWRGELNQCTGANAASTVECHCSLIRNDAGEAESLVLVNRDVTERKHLERQLQSLNVTQNMNLLSQSIAHDLGSVLSPVRMATGHLRNLTGSGNMDSGKLEKPLEVIEQSIESGAALLRKLSPAGCVAERKTIDVARLMSESIKHLRHIMPGNLVIQQDVEGTLHSIEGDATHLRQVLLNLATNARDAMPDGGLLRLSARNVSLDQPFFHENQPGRPGDYVLLRVTDSGAGIPAKIQSKIFQPYFTTKPFGEGTGLGLATVSRVVYGSGGFVRFNSQPGQGTKFYIYLPVANGGGATTDSETPKKRRRKSILVVDDDPVMLKLTAAMLQHGGYETITAADGREGLAAMADRSDAIELIVTDVRMPNINGLAMVRKLRQQRCETPVIVMTGAEVGKEFTEFSELLNVKHFLAKPFSLPDFMNRVQLAMQVFRKSKA